MKFVKIISVASDGSAFFLNKSVTSQYIKKVSFKIEDEKTFFLNKRKKVKKFDLKQVSSYKKKYFK